MTVTSKAIEQAARLIGERIREIDTERRSLESALASLTGNGRASRPPSRAKSSGSRLARRRRGGSRSDQAVKMIAASPGISASEIAKEMKIKPNYLYRVLAELEKQGRIRKQGRAYHPA